MLVLFYSVRIIFYVHIDPHQTGNTEYVHEIDGYHQNQQSISREFAQLEVPVEEHYTSTIVLPSNYVLLQIAR